MTKCKKCYSLDEKVVSGISASAAKRGIPESEVVQNILHIGLAKDSELTMAERFHFQRNSINKSLDNLLLIFGTTVEGGISDKFTILCTLQLSKSRDKKRQSRYAVMEQSLFEILNDLKEMDMDLHKEWCTELSKHGKLRERYFYLYPKCDEKGMKVKNIDTLLTNNTTNSVTQCSHVNSVTQSSVTESTQQKPLSEKIKKYHPELSDEEYLKSKRHEKYLRENESKKKP